MDELYIVQRHFFNSRSYIRTQGRVVWGYEEGWLDGDSETDGGEVVASFKVWVGYIEENHESQKA